MPRKAKRKDVYVVSFRLKDICRTVAVCTTPAKALAYIDAYHWTDLMMCSLWAKGKTKKFWSKVAEMKGLWLDGRRDELNDMRYLDLISADGKRLQKAFYTVTKVTMNRTPDMDFEDMLEEEGEETDDGRLVPLSEIHEPPGRIQ